MEADREDYWNLDQISVRILLKDKLKHRFSHVWPKFCLDEFLPGLILEKKVETRNARFYTQITCMLCNHIAILPVKCSECKNYYCIQCAFILYRLKWLEHYNPQPNLKEFYGKMFECLVCPTSRLTKIGRLNDDEKEVFRGLTVKCRSYNCTYVSTYLNVLRHLDECKTESYKIHSVLNYLYFKKKELPLSDRELLEKNTRILNAHEFAFAFDYRVMIQGADEHNYVDGFRATKVILGADQKLRVIRLGKKDEKVNIPGATSFNAQKVRPYFEIDDDWNVPSPPKFIRSDEDSVATTSSKIPKISLGSSLVGNDESSVSFTPPIAASTDFITATDYSSDLNQPSTSKQLNDLSFYLLPDKSKIRTTDVRSVREILEDESIDSDAQHHKLRKRKIRDLQKASGQLRSQDERRKRKITERLLSRRSKIDISTLTLKQHIFEAWKTLIHENTKVCAIDIEKCEVLTNSGEVKQLPIWISIVDEQANVVIDKLCRYPIGSIQNYGTIFHGLTWDDIKGADHFAIVRKQVMDTLIKYDRIVVASGANDFLSMGFTPDDWDIIRDKIRDVNIYYSYCTKKQQLALKYITFCLFGRIIQDGNHSPVTDALYTLLAYLVDLQYFEKVHSQTYLTCKKPFVNKKYPTNLNMAWLIKRIMSKVGDWPVNLRRPIHPKWSWSSSFDPADIEVNENFTPRPPYSDVPLEQFNEFVHRW